MNGPGGTVIRSVATAIKEELTQIKDTLDLGARGAHSDDIESFQRVSESLVKIGNTLLMLGLVDASTVIKDQANHVKNWTEADVDPEGEQFNAVADALLFVENSIAALAPRAGGLDSTEADAESATKEGMSITQLEDARRVVVSEARAGLSLAKRAITSYIDSNWDGMHLNNVPTTLNTVWGGLLFLQIGRAASVLKSCENFISNKLLAEKLKPDQHTLETLADAPHQYRLLSGKYGRQQTSGRQHSGCGSGKRRRTGVSHPGSLIAGLRPAKRLIIPSENGHQARFLYL